MPILKFRPLGSRIMTGVHPTAQRLVRSNVAGVMAPATGLPQIQSRARPLENAAPAQTYVSFTNTPAQRPSESPYFRGPSHTLGGDMPPNPAAFYAVRPQAHRVRPLRSFATQTEPPQRSQNQLNVFETQNFEEKPAPIPALSLNTLISATVAPTPKPKPDLQISDSTAVETQEEKKAQLELSRPQQREAIAPAPKFSLMTSSNVSVKPQQKSKLSLMTTTVADTPPAPPPVRKTMPKYDNRDLLLDNQAAMIRERDAKIAEQQKTIKTLIGSNANLQQMQRENSQLREENQNINDSWQAERLHSSRLKKENSRLKKKAPLKVEESALTEKVDETKKVSRRTQTRAATPPPPPPTKAEAATQVNEPKLKLQTSKRTASKNAPPLPPPPQPLTEEVKGRKKSTSSAQTSAAKNKTTTKPAPSPRKTKLEDSETQTPPDNSDELVAQYENEIRRLNNEIRRGATYRFFAEQEDPPSPLSRGFDWDNIVAHVEREHTIAENRRNRENNSSPMQPTPSSFFDDVNRKKKKE